ncbi:MAG: hypothetical protein QT03_C0001G0104 [archaeon GW2011_AR10]|nr:MAG: hypothetical protein QT03_C0001G0104 [archaeon GW2011_AR10]
MRLTPDDARMICQLNSEPEYIYEVLNEVKYLEVCGVPVRNRVNSTLSQLMFISH